MAQFLDFVIHWMQVIVEMLWSVAAQGVAFVTWPAELFGIPAEIFVAALLCAVLLALWRAMGSLT